jgi:hypothetical protein
MKTIQTAFSTHQGNGKGELKRDGENFIEKLDFEVKQIPEVGQLWIENEWRGETLTITQRRFITAITGKAHELLHRDTGIDKGARASSCFHMTLLTHHKLNGRPATFVWIEVEREYLNPDEIEVTLKIPKKMVPTILGKNEMGYSLWGKIQEDVKELYQKKATRR